MKTLQKIIFKPIRFVLGKTILSINYLFPAHSTIHSADVKEKLDHQAQSLKLYQFNACPFCVKVRRQIKRLGLSIETRDILKHKTFESQLIQKGGKRQVPCLLVIHSDQTETWLYESGAINTYLEKMVSEFHP